MHIIGIRRLQQQDAGRKPSRPVGRGDIAGLRAEGGQASGGAGRWEDTPDGHRGLRGFRTGVRRRTKYHGVLNALNTAAVVVIPLYSAGLRQPASQQYTGTIIEATGTTPITTTLTGGTHLSVPSGFSGTGNIMGNRTGTTQRALLREPLLLY